MYNGKIEIRSMNLTHVSSQRTRYISFIVVEEFLNKTSTLPNDVHFVNLVIHLVIREVLAIKNDTKKPLRRIPSSSGTGPRW